MAETRDVNVGGIFGFMAGLSIVCAGICLGAWLLFTWFAGRQTLETPAIAPLAAERSNRVPPEPRLQVNPRKDLRDLRAAEDTLLTTYGWVDKGAGVVRIPIDAAMKRVVARRLPARQGAR